MTSSTQEKLNPIKEATKSSSVIYQALQIGGDPLLPRNNRKCRPRLRRFGQHVVVVVFKTKQIHVFFFFVHSFGHNPEKELSN